MAEAQARERGNARELTLTRPRRSLRKPSQARDRSLRYALLVLLALVATGLGLRLLNAASLPALQNFLLVFSALLVEALPFVLLGAVVSAAVEVFVPSRMFHRLGRMPGVVQVPVAAMGGFASPCASADRSRSHAASS
ncbi:MAG: hypothetical protein ACRDH8_15100 [Actinomycetota bacterium]